MLKRQYVRKSNFLWSAALIFLTIQIAHGQDNHARDLLNSGGQAFAAGNYKQAEVELRQAVADSSASDEVLAYATGELGNLLLTVDRLDEAETMLDRSIGMLRAQKNGASVNYR